MKKMIKFSLTLILMLSVILAIFQTSCFASGYATEMETLIKANYSDSTGTDAKVNNITATVITTIRIVGIAVAIVMLLTIAMKYMTAAPGEKADIKKSAVQYVVGAIVLFGVVGILTIISMFSTGIQA